MFLMFLMFVLMCYGWRYGGGKVVTFWSYFFSRSEPFRRATALFLCSLAVFQSEAFNRVVYLFFGFAVFPAIGMFITLHQPNSF